MHRPHPADLPAQPEKAPHLAQRGRKITAAALLLLCTGAWAGPSAYSWTDANGQVHFGDRPPRDSNAQPVEIRVNTYTAPAEVTREANALAENRTIILYTTQRCGYCRKAKAFLTGRGIAFKEYDVENSTRGRADYRRLEGRGVPIILVGEQRMNGYSEDGLSALLREAGYPL